MCGQGNALAARANRQGRRGELCVLRSAGDVFAVQSWVLSQTNVEISKMGGAAPGQFPARAKLDCVRTYVRARACVFAFAQQRASPAWVVPGAQCARSSTSAPGCLPSADNNTPERGSRILAHAAALPLGLCAKSLREVSGARQIAFGAYATYQSVVVCPE